MPLWDLACFCPGNMSVLQWGVGVGDPSKEVMAGTARPLGLQLAKEMRTEQQLWKVQNLLRA